VSAPKIVIIYATSYGQTAKIARHIARLLTLDGLAVTVMPVDQVPRDLVLQNFDATVLGGSILFGRHQRALVRFIRQHRAALNAVPSAFFSVSGSAASTNAAERGAALRLVERLLANTGWRPRLTTTFGGAMAFTRYNPLVRFMMKRISAREGGPTDTSRDY